MSLTTFKATAQSLDKGMQVETSSSGFKVLIDEPERLGGTDEGMTPIELALCALGACHTIVAKMYAKQQGILLEDFRVELEGDIDFDGFRGKPDVRPGFQTIRYKYFIKSDASEEKAREFAELIQRVCPIGDSLENQVALELVDVIIEE